MEIKKIYVDMDGVLADFHEGTKRICGVTAEDQSSGNDIDMWEAIRTTDNFYQKLNPVEGDVEMAAYLVERYGDRVEILSAIPRPNKGVLTAREDKLIWAAKIYPQIKNVNIVYRSEKKDFAKGPEYILIDDYAKNVDDWTASGGTGVLFTKASLIPAEMDRIEAELATK